METTIMQTAFEQKKSEVKSKAIRQLMPEFDENSFAAELLTSGISFTEIKEKVNAAKKAHKESLNDMMSFEEVKSKLSGNIRANLLKVAEISETKFQSMSEIYIYSIVDGKLSKETPTTTKGIIDAILSQTVFAEYCRKNAIDATKQETALNDALKIVASNFVSLGLSYSELTAKLSRAIDTAKVEQNKLVETKKQDKARLLQNYWFATNQAENLLHDILGGILSTDANGKPKYGKAKRNKLVAQLRRYQSSRKTCKNLLGK